MIAILALSVWAVPGNISAFAAMGHRKPIGKPSIIRQDGPSHSDRTVGKLNIYSYRADWNLEIQRLRKVLKRQSDLNEMRGGYAALWPFTGADWRMCWGRECLALGLYRDFRAKPQKVGEVFGGPILKGKTEKGWITVLAFDGRIELVE